MCGLIAKPSFCNSSIQILSKRGPDKSSKVTYGEYTFTFNRLSIMDISDNGNQPFEDDTWLVMCNGEIYNHKELRLLTNEYDYLSNSDCEVLLPMLNKYNIFDICIQLDGEFAFVAYNKKTKQIIAARDPMGIRPLFYGYCSNGKIAFASEIKAIMDDCEKVFPFPPGHYYDGKEIIPFLKLYDNNKPQHKDLNFIFENINKLLTLAVEKRLSADAPIGFLLSGGLDSSLVCSIASKLLNKQIETFAIGLNKNPIDLKYAKQMSEYLGTKHHEVIFTKNDIYDNLRHVIWSIESWDITTIRASIPMYLLCQYIKINTKVKVVFTGEISDELFGYKYTDFAPNALEFQKESEKRIKELYMYDVLRADRCISSNSLEARVPFSDSKFINFVMNIDPELKLNKYNMGKFLLRKAFDNGEYLPHDILWRDKAAFSDAVGHDLVDTLIDMAESKYTDLMFEEKSKKFKNNPPLTKESLMYREIFNELFNNQDHVISQYWLPNQNWDNCNLNDPSARHLPNYGLSGV